MSYSTGGEPSRSQARVPLPAFCPPLDASPQRLQSLFNPLPSLSRCSHSTLTSLMNTKNFLMLHSSLVLPTSTQQNFALVTGLSLVLLLYELYQLMVSLLLSLSLEEAMPSFSSYTPLASPRSIPQGPHHSQV